MSRSVDLAGWSFVFVAGGLGLVGIWASDSGLVSVNEAKATVFTLVVFIALAMALRTAWRRPRLWADLLIALALHVAFFLPIINLLDSRSVRLNWIMALPVVLMEFLLLLGLLWRKHNGAKP